MYIALKAQGRCITIQKLTQEESIGGEGNTSLYFSVLCESTMWLCNQAGKSSHLPSVHCHL